ncbi:hypothetical protein ILYODFUR_016772 [Ilyodon furcidens]|uniref:Vomeronasal type-1 receptor n=1 Tax=Ilyodon furcidens TaxID=33524 RepID=A0ABV0VF39_9TELE
MPVPGTLILTIIVIVYKKQKTHPPQWTMLSSPSSFIFFDNCLYQASVILSGIFCLFLAYFLYAALTNKSTIQWHFMSTLSLSLDQKWGKGKLLSLLSVLFYEGQAVSLNLFIKAREEKQKKVQSQFPSVGKFSSCAGGCSIVLVFTYLICFLGFWFCLIHNSYASSKEELCLCMLESKHVVSLYLSPQSKPAHMLTH